MDKSALNEGKRQWARGTHVLITGASKGIGRELAVRLAGVCRRLTLVARNRDGKLDELKAELSRGRASGKNASAAEIQTCPMDICDKDEIVKLVSRIHETEKDPVELFVNCAGGTHVYATLEEMSHADIERIIDTNAKAPVFWLKELLPRMKKNPMRPGDLKRGHIVLLSSRSGERALPMLGVYAAAKGAVEKLAEAMQREYAQHRIAFTLVNPGSIDTAFTDDWGKGPRDAHNAESMTVAEAVLPILEALNFQFVINKISYESTQQWLNEPGVLK